MMNPIQHLEVICKHCQRSIRARFIGNFIHIPRIIHESFSDMKEYRHLPFHIIHGMYFDATILLAELHHQNKESHKSFQVESFTLSIIT